MDVLSTNEEMLDAMNLNTAQWEAVHAVRSIADVAIGMGDTENTRTACIVYFGSQS